MIQEYNRLLFHTYSYILYCRYRKKQNNYHFIDTLSYAIWRYSTFWINTIFFTFQLIELPTSKCDLDTSILLAAESTKTKWDFLEVLLVLVFDLSSVRGNGQKRLSTQAVEYQRWIKLLLFRYEGIVYFLSNTSCRQGVKSLCWRTATETPNDEVHDNGEADEKSNRQ